MMINVIGEQNILLISCSDDWMAHPFILSCRLIMDSDDVARLIIIMKVVHRE